jgi:hypothetical protein
LRGEHHVFDSGEHLCWWVRERCEAHADLDAGFAQPTGGGTSGVQIPWDLADRFVLMRLAELLVHKEVDMVLGPMIEEKGNTGMIQLLGNLDVIGTGLRELQARVHHATVDEVHGDGT